MDRVCGGGAGFGDRPLFNFLIPRNAGIGFGSPLIVFCSIADCAEFISLIGLANTRGLCYEEGNCADLLELPDDQLRFW